MTMGKFRRCHAVTARWEGGWSDHPADPGGKTMYGITEAVYHGWLKRQGRRLRPVRQITRDEAERVYFSDYWSPCGGPRLAVGVDLATYDASVNSGVSRGRKWLLAAIGGPDHETVKRLCARRLAFVQSLKIWKSFGRGWARRIADVEAKGVAWALAASMDGSGVKTVLEREAEKAGKTARAQETGAGGAGAGGGGAVAADRASDLGDWIVTGVVIIAIVAVVILIARSRINKARRDAYEREAAAVTLEKQT